MGTLQVTNFRTNINLTTSSPSTKMASFSTTCLLLVLASCMLASTLAGGYGGYRLGGLGMGLGYGGYGMGGYGMGGLGGMYGGYGMGGLGGMYGGYGMGGYGMGGYGMMGGFGRGFY